MQVTETKMDGLVREFAVAIPASEVDEKVTSRLQELSRTMRMPGFRPGKVPVSLLRKRFGAAARVEALEEAVNETSTAVMTERGLRPAGRPNITVTSSDADGDFEYQLAVEILPEIPEPEFDKIKVERLTAPLDPAQVDKTLGELAEGEKSFAPLEGDRPATTGDQLLIDFVGRIDGEEFAGGKAEDYELELGSNVLLPGFEDQLVGCRAGDTKTVAVSFPEGYSAESLAGKAAEFEVRVKEVRERKASAIDDAFAKKFGLEDVAALRKMIEESETQKLKAYSRMRMKRSLLDVLAEMYTFPVPPSLVSHEYRTIVDRALQERPERHGDTKPGGHADADAEVEAGPADDDHVHHDHEHEHDHEHHGHDHHAHDHDHDHDHDHHAHDHDHDHDEAPADAFDDSALTEPEREEYRSVAERRVRLGLVLSDVARRHNLQVSREELQRALSEQVRRFPGQEANILEFFKKRPEAMESLAGPILEDKVVDFLIEMGTVTDREVSVDELTRDADADPTVSAAEQGEAEQGKDDAAARDDIQT